MSWDKGVIVFGYYVNDFNCYGVVNFDSLGNVIDIEEKFVKFKFFYVVIGLYFYDNDVVDIVKFIKFFLCGELEIMDVNKVYLKWGDLKVELLGCGIVWLDIGIYDFLFDVGNFIKLIEEW